MWLTHCLSDLRQQQVIWENWKFILDPEARGFFAPIYHILTPVFQVFQQSDSYSCGVHALWYIKHLLHFGEVHLHEEDPQWSFSSTMNVKRVMLAEELLSLADKSLEDILEES